MQIGLDVWASILLRYRVGILAVLSLLVLVAFFGAGHIRFEDGMRQLFQSEHPVFEHFEDAARNIPQPDSDILVLTRSSEPLNLRQLEILRDFTLDGQLIEGITMVSSIFSLQKFDRESGDFVNVIGDDLDGAENINGLLGEAHDSGFADIALINPEFTKTIMHFSVGEAHQDMQSGAPLITEIDALMQQVEKESGLKLSMSGLSPIRHRIVDNLAEEQILLNIVGGIFGSLVSLFLFRSFWIGALNGVAPAFALLFTLGAFGLFGINMNVITNSVTVLILVLAMADSIHMTHELRRKLLDGHDIDEALRKMLIEIGPPALLTSLTTMIAFASLFYSQSVLIDSFAIAGLAGLGATLIAIFVIHPLVYRFAWKYAPVRKAFMRPLLERQYTLNGLMELTEKLIRWRYRIMPGGLVVLILLLIWFFPVQTDHRFQEYLYDNDPMVETLAEIEDISAPSQAIFIVLRPVDPTNGLISAEHLGELSKAHDLLAKGFPQNKIVSLQNLRDMSGTQDGGRTEASLTKLLEIMPDPARHALIRKDESAFVMTLLVHDENSRTIRTLSEKIHHVLASVNFEHLKVERPTGLHSMAAYMSNIMIGELIISFLIAAMLCPLLIALWFRRWTYGLAAILPNLLPTLIVGTYLMYSGEGIRFTSAIALTIAFGVAVDDTIHLINRYHLMRSTEADKDYHATIASAVRHVAPALVTTTCVLAAGLSSSLLSGMPTVIFFGMLCVGIFFLALIADLLLLPPALAVFERYSMSKKHVLIES